jgi:hypothetical protein
VRSLGLVNTTQPFVHAARLSLRAGADPAGVGGAVTVALCGHWHHDGACRWPHNNDIDTTTEPVRFRTLFVAPPEDEAEVRARIERALRDHDGWTVVDSGRRALLDSETALAARLARVAD